MATMSLRRRRHRFCSTPRNPGSAQVEGVVVPIGGDFHIQARRAGIPVLGWKSQVVGVQNDMNVIRAGWHTIAPAGDEPEGAVCSQPALGAVVIRIEANDHVTERMAIQVHATGHGSRFGRRQPCPQGLGQRQRHQDSAESQHPAKPGALGVEVHAHVSYLIIR